MPPSAKWYLLFFNSFASTDSIRRLRLAEELLRCDEKSSDSLERLTKQCYKRYIGGSGKTNIHGEWTQKIGGTIKPMNILSTYLCFAKQNKKKKSKTAGTIMVNE